MRHPVEKFKISGRESGLWKMVVRTGEKMCQRYFVSGVFAVEIVCSAVESMHFI